MPNSTYFGATLTNLGPLVTQFTPAPSCSEPSNLAVATQASDGLRLFGFPECNLTASAAGCFPDGSKIDELWNPTVTDFINTLVYHSPGIACLSGWTTAGSIVGPSGWDSAAGFFTRRHFPYRGNGSNTLPDELRAFDQYVGALDPSETLVHCCPSGMDVDIGGGCYSSIQPLASYSYSGVCLVSFGGGFYETVTTFDGSVYPGGILSPITPTESVTLSTIYDLLTDSVKQTDPGTIIVTERAPVVLIHKEEDMKKSYGGGDGDDDDAGDSAAARLKPANSGLWGSLAPAALAVGTVLVTMIML